MWLLINVFILLVLKFEPDGLLHIENGCSVHGEAAAV